MQMSTIMIRSKFTKKYMYNTHTAGSRCEKGCPGLLDSSLLAFPFQLISFWLGRTGKYARSASGFEGFACRRTHTTMTAEECQELRRDHLLLCYRRRRIANNGTCSTPQRRNLAASWGADCNFNMWRRVVALLFFRESRLPSCLSVIENPGD